MNTKQIILKYGSLNGAFETAKYHIALFTDMLKMITYNIEVKIRYESKLKYYNELKTYCENEKSY